MSRLDWDSFLQVVRDAPLVSIDLFLRNHDGEVLMGRRRNAPAEDYWFVPGGRIEKDQTLDLAFSDICEKEGIGSEARLQEARFMGVYEHFYENDNAGGLPGVNTHCVALAFEVDGVAKSVTLSDKQHKESKWQDSGFVLSDPRVHPYVKQMFEGHGAYPTPGDRAAIFAQYQLVADRRNTTNALLRQSPVPSLTAHKRSSSLSP